MIAALLLAAAAVISRGDVLVSETSTAGPCVNGTSSESVSLLDGRNVRQISTERSSAASRG